MHHKNFVFSCPVLRGSTLVTAQAARGSYY